MCVCVCTNMACVCRGRRRSWISGVGVTGSYELPDMGTKLGTSGQSVDALNH